MATGKDTGADVLPRLKGVFPGHVHEVSRASTAHADHTALGQGFHEAVAKLYRLLDGGRTGGGEVVGMDMHVPQPRQEIGPVQVDHLCLVRIGGAAALAYLYNTSVLHGHTSSRQGLRMHTVNDIGIDQHHTHRHLIDTNVACWVSSSALKADLPIIAAESQAFRPYRPWGQTAARRHCCTSAAQ